MAAATNGVNVALVMCPICVEEDDISLVEARPDGTRLLRHRCGHEWVRGEAAPPPRPTTIEALRRQFPSADDVEPQRLARALALKVEYLAREPELDQDTAAYWVRYQQVFSRDGLWTCDPQDLKDFANSGVGANPGNQSVFNRAWNELGQKRAAESTRRTLEYLLYGPETVPIEDRLTQLIAGTKPFSMTGFKESLLTRALCVVHPDRYLSILKYTTEAGGKREIARSLYGLELPAPESVSWTLGRLIVWSNDLLRDLIGEGFVNQQHAAAFLWDAKDRA